MPTTVTKTIGTSSRDYSTLQAWEDASPANLVTSDQIWRGECYNDSEFTAGNTNVLVISGETVDATRYVELTAAAGQSFQDNANVRTNALKYNVSNGVGIRCTTGYNIVISTTIQRVRISRLQIKHSGTGNALSMAAANCFIKDLIIDAGATAFGFSQSTAINCFVFNHGTAGSGFSIAFPGGSTLIGCVGIRTTDNSPAGTCFDNTYSTNTLISCASFGFTTPAAGSWTGSKNNATDAASGLPGTSNQHSVTYNSTSPFTNSTVASQNSIPVASTALAANGFLDSTNAPNDITVTARAASPTIGAWELAAAGGALTFTGTSTLGSYADSDTIIEGRLVSLSDNLNA